MTAVDGLGHVVEALRDVDASTVPEAAPLIGELRAIHAGLRPTDRPAISMVEHRPQAVTVKRMRALSDTAMQPLMVDLRLGTTVVLPRQVAVKAALAAGALLRLSAAPTGVPAWRDYHGRTLGGQAGPATALAEWAQGYLRADAAQATRLALLSALSQMHVIAAWCCHDGYAPPGSSPDRDALRMADSVASALEARPRPDHVELARRVRQISTTRV